MLICFKQIADKYNVFQAVKDIIKKSSTITDSVPFLVGQLNQSLAETLSWNFTDVFQYCTFGGENCDMPYCEITQILFLTYNFHI